MKRSFALLLSCVCPLLYAQPSNSSANKAAQKAYTQAAPFISAKNYGKAAEQLTIAVKLDPTFIAAWQQLGDVSRRREDYLTAKDSYRQVLRLNPEFTPLTYYGLAESEFNTGEYASALDHFKKYSSNTGLSESSKKLVARAITNAEFSILAVKNPVAFNPINMGAAINTSEQEYLPALTADDQTVIFTRQVNNDENFFSSAKKQGAWTTAKPLSSYINTAEYNEGAQYLSPDGLYLFFTGCNRPDGLGRCDIYLSRKEGNDWSKPFNLGPPVNTGGWESQPSLSADGRTLYFTSNRAGGLGGYDIWKSELKPDASWTTPVNLGPEINTPYDEQAAFLHPDGQTLYFSSDGWPGLGKKDLFVSRKDDSGNWQKPQNLGFPINTFGDESGITISNDGKTAFLTSNKPGGYGGWDIYSFELPVQAQPRPVTYVTGTIFDKDTQAPLDGHIIVIDLKTGNLIYDGATDAGNGKFLISLASGQNLAFTVEREDYLFFSENIPLDKPNSADKPLGLPVPLQKIRIGSSVTLKNVFFDTNQYNLLDQSKTELQELIRFLNLNKLVKVEIQGHTDDVGDDSANQTLSENRAKAVYGYLINAGIAPARLAVKGYGETKPIADNETDEGRQKNRRTQFVITGLKN